MPHNVAIHLGFRCLPKDPVKSHYSSEQRVKCYSNYLCRVKNAYFFSGNAYLCIKTVDVMTRLILQEQSDIGLHCLSRSFCQNVCNFRTI